MRLVLPDSPDPERWVPKTDIYISDDGCLIIEMELAAMKKEDLELTIGASTSTWSIRRLFASWVATGIWPRT